MRTKNKNIGVQKIRLTGSHANCERVIWKNEVDGTFWIKWYGNYIQVKNTYNDEYSSSGWFTVELY